MKWTLLLLSLFWLNLGFCQKIALKDAISDLEFLNHAVVEGHPVNYEPGHTIVQLPNSKVEIRFPVYRLISDPNSQQRTGLIPNVVVEYGIEDILQAKDLEMDMIMKLCK